MQVILTKEVPSLGREGDVVKVAQGYANNYLIPKGLAVTATPGSLKQLDQRRAAIDKRREAERAQFTEAAAKMDGKSVTIKAKAGEEGRLYGSITAKDVAAAIQEQLGVEIDRRKVELAEAIKEPGEISVGVRLHPEVKATVTVTVEAEA